jgi:hypothetical protein
LPSETCYAIKSTLSASRDKSAEDIFAEVIRLLLRLEANHAESTKVGHIIEKIKLNFQSFIDFSEYKPEKQLPIPTIIFAAEKQQKNLNEGANYDWSEFYREQETTIIKDADHFKLFNAQLTKEIRKLVVKLQPRTYQSTAEERLDQYIHENLTNTKPPLSITYYPNRYEYLTSFARSAFSPVRRPRRKSRLLNFKCKQLMIKYNWLVQTYISIRFSI